MPNLDLCYIPGGVLAFSGNLLHMQFLSYLRSIDQGTLYYVNLGIAFLIYSPTIIFLNPTIAKRKAEYYTWNGRGKACIRMLSCVAFFGFYGTYLWFLYYGLGVCFYALAGGPYEVVQNLKNLLIFQGIFACLPCGIFEGMGVIKYGITDVSAPVLNCAAFVIILVAAFCDRCFSNSASRIRFLYIRRIGFFFIDNSRVQPF